MTFAHPSRGASEVAYRAIDEVRNQSHSTLFARAVERVARRPCAPERPARWRPSARRGALSSRHFPPMQSCNDPAREKFRDRERRPVPECRQVLSRAGFGVGESSRNGAVWYQRETAPQNSGRERSHGSSGLGITSRQAADWHAWPPPPGCDGWPRGRPQADRRTGFV